MGLTQKGVKIKEELMAEYRLPPPLLQELSEADLRQLIEVFQKIQPPS